MSRVPITRVRTSHALTIKVNGQAIGLINGWTPTQGRAATPVFEVGTDGSGNPVETVPGNANGLTLTINRFDTYLLRMEEAFGTRDLIMLTRQNQPFDVMEVWKLPNITDGYNEKLNAGGFTPQANAVSVPNAIFGDLSIGTKLATDAPSPFTGEERFIYRGCWFTSLGRTLRADDNRIVNVNATIAYTIKQKVNGTFGRALSFRTI